MHAPGHAYIISTYRLLRTLHKSPTPHNRLKTTSAQHNAVGGMQTASVTEPSTASAVSCTLPPLIRCPGGYPAQSRAAGRVAFRVSDAIYNRRVRFATGMRT